MKNLIAIFLIGHLIADFLLQSANMAELKKEKKRYWIGHSAIYAAIFIVLSFVCLRPKFAIIYASIIAITHCIVDLLRIILDKKSINKPQVQFTLFVIDQIIHIIIVIALCFLLNLDAHINDFYCKVSEFTNFTNIVLYSLLFLSLTNPSAVFVKKLLSMLFAKDDVKEKIKTASNKKRDKNTTVQKSVEEDDETNDNPNVGFTIGILERVITAVLLLCNQYSAIGLVLTAKSIARFKQLEKRDFAEKYLIGTLTSLLISLIATIIIVKLL